MLEFPKKRVSNGLLEAEVYLPDSSRGFYRGTRFEWAGVIGSLRYQEHEYFGKWKDFHAPDYHDCITGPAGEFDGGAAQDDDFLRAEEGQPFLRLGVGLLKKIAGGQFSRFSTYPILDSSSWIALESPGRISFDHTAASPTGLSYRYRKVLSLAEQAPRLTLEHTIENTCSIPIATRHYYHNFFRIDGIPIGPLLQLELPMALCRNLELPDPLVLDGSKIALTRSLGFDERILARLPGKRMDYALELCQRASGARVRIGSDQPLSSLLLWMNHSVFCPEPYVDIFVAPGKEFTWRVWYEFSALDLSS